MNKNNIENLLKEEELYLVEYSFSPSPKQFISESRKTRDLAISSFIISYFLQYSLKEILKEYDDTVLLPFFTDKEKSEKEIHQSKPFNLINRCIVLLKKNDIQKFPQELNSKWKQICQTTLENFSDNIVETIEAETEQIFSPMWVAVKIKNFNVNSDFSDNISRLQNKVLSRKFTRNFTYYKGDTVVKCNICYKRKAINSKTSSMESFWKNKAKQAYFKEGERACIACATKRLLGEQIISKFESTTAIAGLLLQSRVAQNTFHPNLTDTQKSLLKELYSNITGKKSIHKDHFYTTKHPYELLSIDSTAWQNLENKKANSANIKAIERENQKFLERNSFRALPAYYSILRMDADNMGRAFSENKLSWEQIRCFSKELKYLSDVVYPFVVENIWQGQIIFSSGDELMAMGPVIGGVSHYSQAGNSNEHLLITSVFVANLLRECFCLGNIAIKNFLQTIQINYPNIHKFLKEKWSQTQNSVAESDVIEESVIKDKTISAGLLICHRNYALKNAIEQCFEAENLAKQERNSIGIIVNVRSGTHHKFTAKWATTINSNELYISQLFDLILQAITDKKISPHWLRYFIEDAKIIMFKNHTDTSIAMLKQINKTLYYRHKASKNEKTSVEQPKENINDIYEGALNSMIDIYKQGHIYTPLKKENYNHSALKQVIDIILFFYKYKNHCLGNENIFHPSSL